MLLLKGISVTSDSHLLTSSRNNRPPHRRHISRPARLPHPNSIHHSIRRPMVRTRQHVLGFASPTLSTTPNSKLLTPLPPSDSLHPPLPMERRPLPLLTRPNISKLICRRYNRRHNRRALPWTAQHLTWNCNGRAVRLRGADGL